MKNTNPNPTTQKINDFFNNPAILKGLALIAFALLILSQIFSIDIKPKFTVSEKTSTATILSTGNETSGENSEKNNISAIQQAVLPSEGVTLPISWGDLGKKMIADGVIDETKFRQLFQEGLGNDEEAILTGNYDKPIVMTQQNSRFMLDMLWAFGLSNKNDILENGEMTDEKYGGDASKFAATGGWSLSTGSPMDHYSTHSYVTLTPEQQDLVDKVSRNIYRPCCGNSTHFPDCNHGMAMLGLLELMAANNVSEDEMYKVALQVNANWFPQTYIDLATYFEEQGTEWKDVDAKLALSQKYSSAQGYQQTRQQIKSLPEPPKGGGGCGV